MSLHPHPAPPVPAETARVARAAFRRGHPYLKLRDECGTFFQDEAFAALFSPVGPPALAPWRLALVTLLQYAEGLSDEQAAEAVRGRIEWKYLLSLPLEDEGFDASVLCEFRQRLVEGQAEALLFDTLLAAFRERKLVKERGKQRTDSTHVLAAIRRLNRLELVGETMRLTLEALAVTAPEWLQAHADPAWWERYARPFSDFRRARSATEREALATAIGQDGVTLLTALEATDAPPEARALPEVTLLRRVWEQQYVREGARLRWRPEEALPPAAERIVSPHDPEARAGKKSSQWWMGYKMHLTETCDAGLPRLITDVQTTPAPVDDAQVLPAIQAALARRGVLPATHLVDGAYTETQRRLESERRYGVTLVGPPQRNTSWQARAGHGFATEDFTVDWEHRVATCPGKKQSISWQEKEDDGRPVVKVRFGEGACRECPLRSRCTRSQTAGRLLTLPSEEVYRALQAAREREGTAAYARLYDARAGIEGTHSQAVRRCGVRTCRYVGETKTHLQHVLTAAAINLVRVGEYLMGREPAQTRATRFAQLATAAS
jgi:transposase